MSVTGFRCYLSMFSSLVIDTEDFYIHDFFPGSVLTGIANKLQREPPGRSVFSPALSLLAPFGTVQWKQSGHWRPKETKSVSIFSEVGRSDSQALDLSPHGHVCEKSLVWGRDIRCSGGCMCEMGFHLYEVCLLLVQGLNLFCDLAVP